MRSDIPSSDTSANRSGDVVASSPYDDFVAELAAVQHVLSLYVRSLMPGEQAFEEVVQQANVKIWQKRDQFEPGTNFKAWAFAIARYEVLNFRKRQSRDRRLKFSEDIEVAMADDLSTRDVSAVRQHALKDCLDQLSARNRALLISRYGSDETLGEFALRHERSVGGLRVTLHRLRSALLRCVQNRVAQTEAGA